MTDKADFVRRVLASITDDLYDQPIITNNFRAHYVERIIARALGDGWHLVSADWAGWDIESATGVKVEVKQSAVRQTWTDRPGGSSKPSKGQFDIKPRTGYWAEGGSTWVDRPGRNADIYIFAWHPIFDLTQADHRDPFQWQFYVVPERELSPRQQSISRSVLDKRWSVIGFDDLRSAVENVADTLT